MKVTRTAAVALFAALGITSADKWNAKRMAAKLNKLPEMVDEDTSIEDTAIEATMTAVLEAIENDEDLEIVATPKGKDDKPAKKGKGDKKGKAADAEKKKADATAKKEKADAEKAEKAAAKKAAADEKKKAAEAAKAARIPGVRETRTRPFLAGIVIKKHGGLKAGVTDEMVAELDELYGKVNPVESIFTLRNAWHAIRGFEQGEE